MISETELAYLAGIFDGEGALAIPKYNHIHKKNGISYLEYWMEARVVNTHLPTIERFKELFGGRVTVRPKITGRRIVYSWAASATVARSFLEAVLPYLKIKKDRAELAVRFQNELSGGKQGGKRTPERLATLENYKLRMNELNKAI